MNIPFIAWASAYLAGLVSGHFLLYFPWTVAIVGMGTAAGAVLFRRRVVFRPAVLIGTILWLLFGMVRILVDQGIVPENDLERFAQGEALEWVGRVREPLQIGPTKTVAILQAESVRPLVSDSSSVIPVRGRLRLTIRGGDASLNYGDRVRAVSKLRPPDGLSNPGGSDYGAYLRRQKIRAVTSLSHPERLEVLNAGGGGTLGALYGLREDIRGIFDRSLSPETAAVLKAMVIGDTLSLDPDIRETFMISGTAHLLSISGTHLAMVAWGMFHFIRWGMTRLPADWLLRLSRNVTPTAVGIWVTLPAAWLYTLLAGARIPTVRSCIMISVFLAALWFQRGKDPLHSLALAALIILIWNPADIFSISFQMSFIAVWAIILVMGKAGMESDESGNAAEASENKPSIYRSGLEKLWALFLVTLAAGAATLPLTLYYFNQISWIGFVSNMIVVPWVGLLTVPPALMLSLGAALAGWTTLPLAGAMEGLTQWLLSIVGFFAQWPGSEVYLPAPPYPVVVLLFASAVIAFFAPNRGMKKWVWIGSLLIPLLVWSVGAAWVGERGLKVIFFDVGQGDAALVELPGGGAMLIDGGGQFEGFDLGRAAVAPYLRNTGRRAIEVMVATHPQLDHMGGLNYIAEKFRVGQVWTNGRFKDALFFRRFGETLKNRGISEWVVSGDPPLPAGAGTVRLKSLNPIPPKGASENDRSLVLRLEYGKVSVLFAGDIEDKAEKWIRTMGGELRSTVLKVPHHGSRSSIDPGFLNQVKPDIAVISVGRNNPYRHPARDTVKAYERLGSRIFRTDLDGAVIFKSDGEQFQVYSFRETLPRPVEWGEGMIKAEMANLSKIFRMFWHLD